MAYVDIVYQTDPTTGQVLFDANGYPLQATNAGANTYSQMQAKIADEILGSPTSAQIKTAIQDAIANFERTPFDFNSPRIFGAVSGSLSDLQTQQGKEFYSSADLPVLANLPHISKVLVLAFANRYPLVERTPQWVDDQSLSTTWQGLPTDWCWQGGMMRLYPVPNGGYPLILDATIRFAPLSADGDYNPWTNRAEALIRYEAKRLLFLNIIRDPDQAGVMEREAAKQLSVLKAEAFRRTGGSGRIRPSRGWM